MKKALSFLLAAVMTASLVACGSGEGDASTTTGGDSSATENTAAADTGSSQAATGDETVEIVYVTHGLEDMFCNWLTGCLEERIASEHPNWNMQLLDGKLSADVQSEQLENAIAMKPDLIFYSAADGYSCTPVVKQAQEAGIPVILVQAPVYDDNDNSVTPYVDCDMYEVGKMVADYGIDLLPENAQVAMLLGPAGNTHSQQRQRGWDEVLSQERPDIQVVDVQIGDWDTAEAMRITEDWLQQYPELVAVLSMNDGMAIGAIEAAKAANRDLYTFGVDGMADGCNAVKEGYLTATALQDARELAKGAVQLAERQLAGEALDGNTVVHVDAALITADNVDEFMKIHEGN